MSYWNICETFLMLVIMGYFILCRSTFYSVFWGEDLGLSVLDTKLKLAFGCKSPIMIQKVNWPSPFWNCIGSPLAPPLQWKDFNGTHNAAAQWRYCCTSVGAGVPPHVVMLCLLVLLNGGTLRRRGTVNITWRRPPASVDKASRNHQRAWCSG